MRNIDCHGRLLFGRGAPVAVAAVQRTDGAVRVNVHLHELLLDGVYVRDDANGQLGFRRLPTSTHAEITEVAAHRGAARADSASARPFP